MKENKQEECHLIANSILNHIKKINGNNSISSLEKSKQIILYTSSFIHDDYIRSELYSICEVFPLIFTGYSHLSSSSTSAQPCINSFIDDLHRISVSPVSDVQYLVAWVVRESFDYLLTWLRVDEHVKIPKYNYFSDFIDEIGHDIAVSRFVHIRHSYDNIVEHLTTKLKESGIIHNS